VEDPTSIPIFGVPSLVDVGLNTTLEATIKAVLKETTTQKS